MLNQRASQLRDNQLISHEGKISCMIWMYCKIILPSKKSSTQLLRSSDFVAVGVYKIEDFLVEENK